MGFWTSNANIGNILGFALTGLIIDVFQFKWEVSMIVVAIIQLLIALQVYCGVEEKPQESSSLMEEEDQEPREDDDEE